MRIPFAVRWPGRIAPGRVSEHLGYCPDVLPTIAEAAGAPTPAGVDGVSFLPELIGADAAGRPQPQHDFLYWEHGRWRAIREGNWRAVQPDRGAAWELYDVGRDSAETQDVAVEQPELLRSLIALAESAREPQRPGTYTSRERADRDRRAKGGRQPADAAPEPTAAPR